MQRHGDEKSESSLHKLVDAVSSVSFLDCRVRHSSNGGWSLHIYTNLTFPPQWGVAIYCTKKKCCLSGPSAAIDDKTGVERM
jgi:hypothetical protein